MTNYLEFFTGLRGFHVYSNTVKLETLQVADIYFQVGTQKLLRKICRCWKNSAERTDGIDHF